MQGLFRAGFAIVALWSGIAACSSGSGSSGTGSGDFGAKWVEFCKADAERDQTCGQTPNETSCQQAQACFEGSWRTSAMPPLLDCLAARQCGESDDPCFESAGQSITKTPSIDAYLARCPTYQTQCGASDDICAASIALLSDATLDQLTACMDKPCADADACLEPHFDTLDCW